MNRSLAALSFVQLLVGASAAVAHPITADGDPADWTMAAPGAVNLGHLGRNPTLQGEYVWTDPQNDERTDFATPDPRVDLRELRITADATNLYVLARMTDIDQATGDGAPQLQVAIDRDDAAGSGERYFASNSETQTAVAAAWERLIVTRFGSGTTTPAVYTAGSWTPAGLGVQAISTTNEVIELAVPWTALGGLPTAPLHFTVITLRGNATDEAWDTTAGGGPDSDVLDAVTNYGAPVTLPTPNTWAEVSDGVVDYRFQLWFHLDPDTEPSPPLVINEVLPNAVAEAGNNTAEWFEIYNRTGAALPLATGSLAYLVSDEETANQNEGTGAFPAGASIGANDVVLLAFNATTYGTEFPSHPAPDYELFNSPSAVPTLVAIAGWSTNGPASINLTNGTDELLLFDPCFTVIDVAGWGTSTYAGTTYRTAPAESRSIERPQPREDTNDCTVDFYYHLATDITPGSVWGGNGTACTVNAQCGSSFCADGVCCNSACGGSATDDCQACSLAAGGTANGTCTALGSTAAPSVTCRVSAGGCDLAEACSATSMTCPTDAFRPATYECRAATGTGCDVAEFCTGSAVDCPTDVVRPNTFVCRAAPLACDVAESCDGTTKDCPTDALRPSSYECRAAAGDCDLAESCSGSSTACPTDVLRPSTYVCRTATLPCDIPESCSGSTTACPADGYATAGTDCRSASCASGQATAAADCTGSSALCPAAVLTPCDPYVCGATACLASCGTDGDCTADAWCDAGACVPRTDLGTPCTVDSACSSGFCVDGFCCNSTCDRQCEACDVSGSRGSCSPVTGAPHGDRTTCTSDGSACAGACNGTNPAGCAYPGDTVECRAAACADGMAILAASCQGDGVCPAEQTQDCAPFACSGALCGGDCTIDGDCDVTSYCSAGICVPRLDVGEACAGDTQCADGFCVDGFCCDAACDGQCEACDVTEAEGTCSPVTGDPHGGREACTGTGDCAATCDGVATAACSFPDDTTRCAEASCADGVAVAAGVCNGLGDCAVPDPVDCAPYVCDAVACLDACTGDPDCADGYVCDADACVPEAADADADGDADADADADGSGEFFDDAWDGDVTPPDDGDGCGCRAAGGSPTAGLLVGLLAVFGLLLARRRRS